MRYLRYLCVFLLCLPMIGQTVITKTQSESLIPDCSANTPIGSLCVWKGLPAAAVLTAPLSRHSDIPVCGPDIPSWQGCIVPPPSSQISGMDVPAIERKRDSKEIDYGVDCGGQSVFNETTWVSGCDIVYEKHRWSCADKSRVLLTAEDGSHHCIKFPKEKP